MKRRTFLQKSTLTGTGLNLPATLFSNNAKQAAIKVGMIGLDTSHSVAFAKIINGTDENGQPTGFTISHAYPHGSKDIESSTSRIPGYTKEMIDLGVKLFLL